MAIMMGDSFFQFFSITTKDEKYYGFKFCDVHDI